MDAVGDAVRPGEVAQAVGVRPLGPEEEKVGSVDARDRLDKHLASPVSRDGALMKHERLAAEAELTPQIDHLRPGRWRQVGDVANHGRGAPQPIELAHAPGDPIRDRDHRVAARDDQALDRGDQSGPEPGVVGDPGGQLMRVVDEPRAGQAGGEVAGHQHRRVVSVHGPRPQPHRRQEHLQRLRQPAQDPPHAGQRGRAERVGLIALQPAPGLPRQVHHDHLVARPGEGPGLSLHA
jgi:hypothetical protein